MSIHQQKQRKKRTKPQNNTVCQSESISESICNIEVEQENKSTCTSENKQPVNMSVRMKGHS